MMVSEQEVRWYLDAMPVERVSKETLIIQIRLATEYVSRYKGSLATDEQVWGAELTRAGWLTYQSYATEYERTAGEIPGPVVTHLQRYKDIADEYLVAAQAGTNTVGLITLMELRENRIEANI